MTAKRMTALEKIKLQESQITHLTNRCEKLSDKAKRQEKDIATLNQRCDVAERQARSLTIELKAARRKIAELQSLAPQPKGATA